MPGLTDSLRILITANGAQAEREFAKVGTSARRNLGVAETSAQRYGSILTSAGIAMASFGAASLVGLGMAAGAAEDENQALARLQNSMRNSPALAGASEQAFLDQAAALQDTTQFADEATVSAQALLGQFGLTQSQILELVPLVQDYAAKMGVDLPTAARAVGKATAGTNTTLKRAGIEFDETTYAADNFAGTMDALESSVGGFAGEQGKTLAGQIEILKNNFSDLAEGIGQGAIVVFEDLAGAVGALSDAFGGLSPQAQSTIGQVLTWGAVGLTAAGSISFLVGQVMKLAPAFSAVAGIGPRVYAAIANLIVPTESLAMANTGLAASQTAVAASNPVGWTVALLAAIPPVTAGVAALADKFGELTGLFRFSASLNPFGDDGMFGQGIVQAGGAIGQALADTRGEMDASEEAAAALAAGLDELTAALDDWLAANFDVPAAQRSLRESFEDVFETITSGTGSVDDINAGLEDTVRATSDLVQAQIQQGASQSEVNATIDLSRQRLLAARDAGLITQAQFQTYSAVLNGIKPVVSTSFQTPGLALSKSQTSFYKTLVGSVPIRHNTYFYTDTSKALSDVSFLKGQLQALDGKTFTAYVAVKTIGDPFPKSADGEKAPASDIYVPQPVGAGKSSRMVRRAGGRGGGGDVLVTVPVHLDGQKIAEVVARADRKFNVARGGDTQWG